MVDKYIICTFTRPTYKNINNMIQAKDKYCVILAGGLGRRLWPCSRKEKPKQFLDLFGTGHTALQQTYDRFVKVIPKDNIFIITNANHTHLVREQLPDVAENHILSEPVNRNTAPSIAWAAFHIRRKNPEAIIVVSPSDQLVLNDEAFKKNVNDGIEFVDGSDRLLAMGITPSRPEPGYGYIQIGEDTGSEGLWKVKSFTEKPEREFAKLFMENGEFLWNTGIFIFNTQHILKAFDDQMAPVLRVLEREKPNATDEEEFDYVKENYPRYPNLSLDSAVLEKSNNTFVMKCNFGWADLGTWHSIYEQMPKDAEKNVIMDSNVIMEDSHNNIIKISKGKVAIINGLEGYIVAENDNVIMICKKQDSSSLVKKYNNETQMKLCDDFV